MNKVKLTANILFSGIGAQERGFEDSGLFEIDVLTTSDISKESTLSYAAIHCGLTEELVKNYSNYPSRQEMADYLTKINLGYDPKKNKTYNWHKLVNKKSNDLEKYWLACYLSKNRGDISKIEELPYADMWTVSFPCTDVSIAGAMKGLNPDSGTRSSLLWENIKLLKKAKENNELPKYVLFENVKNLVSKKFINDFNTLLDVMSELGFNTYWKVLNGKDCGIPQHRERVFAMAIRKDIDTGLFTFPQPFDNGIRLKDVLEAEVDEKYYLSEEVQNRFRLTDNTFTKNIIGTTAPDFRTVGQRDVVYNPENHIGALIATDYKQPKQVLASNNIENVGYLDIKGKDQIKRVYGENGISPTLNTMQGGNRQPKVIREYPKANEMLQKIIETNPDIESGQYGTDCTINNPQIREISNCICARYDNGVSTYRQSGTAVLEVERAPLKFLGRNQKNFDGEYAFCIDTTQTGGIKEKYINGYFRIRKLIPKEAWRLMGFKDEDIERAIAVGLKDTHLYAQAGNSIITNCCSLIAEHLYKAQYDNTYICFDENFTNPQMD